MKNFLTKLVLVASLLVGFGVVALKSQPGQNGLNGGDTLPSTCAVKNVWVKTGATNPGLYLCTAANTWTKIPTISSTDTQTNKTFTAPVLGAATATSINGLTFTSSTGTFTLANGKTFVVSNGLTFTGTDSTSFAFPGTSGTVTTLDLAQTLTNKTINGNSNTLTVLAASQLSGFVPIGNICTATNADNTHFLRGDCTWQTISGGGDALQSSSLAQFASTTSAEMLTLISNETGTGVLVFSTNPVFTTSLSVGSAGVKLSDDGDGALTFLGLGNGSDEDLTFNFDDTANTVVASSSTGVTRLTLTSMALAVADDAYDATGWNGNTDVPTKNALRDVIETIATVTGSLTTNGVMFADSATSVKNVAGILTDGTSQLILGVAGTSVGSVKFKNATSGDITLSAVTGALGTVAQLLPARAGTVALETGSTLTTGTIILPYPVIYNAGVSQGGTASIGFSTPATLGATAIAQNGAAGGNAAYGVASFLNSEVDEVQGHFPLTSDWSSTQGIDIQIKWRAISTTGNDVKFQIRTKCVATGEADTAVSYNTAQDTTAVTNLGTTLQWNASSKTALTLTGCAAGEEFHWIISRDTSVSGDTLDQPVQVSGATFTVRRTVTIGG